MRNIVSGSVDHTVVLGQGGYGPALTVTQSGIVAPAYATLPQAGAVGIEIAAGVARANILNQGSVAGAAGSAGVGAMSGYAGGVGIDFSASGRIDNQGTVTGGAGGYDGNVAQRGSDAYSGGFGGVGIYLGEGSLLANTGTVSGGLGGDIYSYFSLSKGGEGGVGIDLGAQAVLTNAGYVSGGGGGHSNYSGVGTEAQAFWPTGPTFCPTAARSWAAAAVCLASHRISAATRRSVWAGPAFRSAMQAG